MIGLTIEVSSGLHAGARWKFNNGLVTLGGNANSEVFLCDDGIPDQCMKMRIFGNRVSLEELASEVRHLGQVGKTPSRTLYAGQSLSLSCRQVQFTISAAEESGLFWDGIVNDTSRAFGSMIEMIRSIGAGTVVTISCLIGLLITTTVLFFGTSNFSESQAFAPGWIDNPDRSKTLRLPPPNISEQLVKVIDTELVKFKDEEKLDQFSVKVETGSVKVDGNLSRIQLVKFERLIKRIAADFGQHMEIVANIELTTEQKKLDQIDIAGVLLGESPVVVLRDGTRLFVGSAFEGIQLSEVSENRLVFVGDARYELPL